MPPESSSDSGARPARDEERGASVADSEMRTQACPTCGEIVAFRRLSDHPAFPFCSSRCRYLDLANWLDGVYRIESPIDLED